MLGNINFLHWKGDGLPFSWGRASQSCGEHAVAMETLPRQLLCHGRNRTKLAACALKAPKILWGRCSATGILRTIDNTLVWPSKNDSLFNSCWCQRQKLGVVRFRWIQAVLCSLLEELPGIAKSHRLSFLVIFQSCLKSLVTSWSWHSGPEVRMWNNSESLLRVFATRAHFLGCIEHATRLARFSGRLVAT